MPIAPEPTIVINGSQVTTGQARMIRVACEEAADRRDATAAARKAHDEATGESLSTTTAAMVARSERDRLREIGVFLRAHLAKGDELP